MPTVKRGANDDLKFTLKNYQIINKTFDYLLYLLKMTLTRFKLTALQVSLLDNCFRFLILLDKIHFGKHTVKSS